MAATAAAAAAAGACALASAGGGQHVTMPSCCSVAWTVLSSKEQRRPWRSAPGGASQHMNMLRDIVRETRYKSLYWGARRQRLERTGIWARGGCALVSGECSLVSPPSPHNKKRRSPTLPQTCKLRVASRTCLPRLKRWRPCVQQ